MNIAIIKYNAGNTKSVEHALHRLGIQPVITDDAEQIQQADKVIFPGVGLMILGLVGLAALSLFDRQHI